jgi:hypothetical protein
MLLKKLLLSTLMLALLSSACSTARSRRSTPPFETKSYAFIQGEVFSKDYDRKVTVPKVRDKKENRIIIDFTKTHPAHEWTHVLENSTGIVATMDHAIEGRGWEVPFLVRRNADQSWSEIPLKKPHFSAEVIELGMDKSGIRIRLRIEPSTAPEEQLTGKMKDESGDPMDYADWTYSFAKKTWTLSRTPLKF